VISRFLERVEALNIEEETAPAPAVDEEIVSMRNLLGKNEMRQLINDPREYQLELFERAKKENIIAVLDTGSGKTLIAVMLLKHILDEELVRRATGHPRRISFFLVGS
jgi:endoribonuclease Dicer